MTASVKPSKKSPTPSSHKEGVNNPAHTEDAEKLPSVLFLLKSSLWTAWKLRLGVYGYAAWLLIPAIVYVFAQGLPSPYANFLISAEGVLGLLLGLWVHAAILLYVALAFTNEIDEDVDYNLIAQRAWQKAPVMFLAQMLSLGLALIGGVLLIIPGLIIWVWTAMVTPILLLSNRGIRDSFKHSQQLTKGKFFPVLWRLLAAEIAFAFLLMVALSAYLSVGLYESASSLLATLETWPNWLQIGLRLILLVLVPIKYIYTLLLYFALKKAYSEGEKHESKV